MGLAIIEFGLNTWIWGGIPFLAPYPAIGTFLILGLMIGGSFAMLASWGEIVSLFVCGECNRIFLSETSLRRHYGTTHTKKDSEESKD